MRFRVPAFAGISFITRATNVVCDNTPKEDQMRKAIAVGLALIMLVVVLVQALAPSPFTLMPVSYATPEMAPTNGDAWTENNNATYTWIPRPPHVDAVVFTTEKSYVGSYSLKVNHTVSTSSINFRLDLKVEQDFSSYDAISCWLFLQGQRSTSLRVSTLDSSGNSFAFILKEGGFDNATWIRVVIPLDAFFVYTGSPLWSRVRYVEFLDAYRGLSDYTTYYVDGLRFTDLETPLVSGSESDLVLPNFFYAISKYGDKQVTYRGAGYNSVYAFVNVDTGVPDSYIVEALESQSLGQTLFALAVAYNITKSDYLRTKIEAYTSWINVLRSITQFKGIRNYMADNAPAGTIQNGWILGGLSYMYNITGEAVYRNIADDIRTMLIDEVWNSTDHWFSQSINLQTGAVKHASWTNDVQGSAVFGLSAYFRFVSANQTVKDRVETCLNTQLTKKFTNFHEAFTTFNFEADSYMHWGYFEAYKAFKNTAYWKYALAQAHINLAYNMIYLNGSMGFRNNFVSMNQDERYGYLDEWGSVNSLLLLMKLHQETGDDNILQSFRKTMLDHIVQVKTPLWLVSRYRNARSSYETQFNTKSWQPTQAFIFAALVKYYYEDYRPVRPYPLLSTKEVETVLWTPESPPLWNFVTEILSDGNNATVLVYVPYDNETEKPFPNDYWQHYVIESTQWGSQWDAPKRILTLWAISESTFRVVLERESIPPAIRAIERIPDDPEYSETVTIKANITDDRSKVRGAVLAHNQSSTWTNITMTLDGFFFTGAIQPAPYGATVAFKVFSFDNAANWIASETLWYIVGDKTPPTIAFRPLTVEKLSSYDEVSIEVEVTEPMQASGVANATLWFRADEGDWQSKELTRAGLWSMKTKVQLEKGVGIMQYYAEAYDDAGNRAVTETYNYIPANNQTIFGLPILQFVGIIIAAGVITVICIYILRARRLARRHAKPVEEPGKSGETKSLESQSDPAS